MTRPLEGPFGPPRGAAPLSSPPVLQPGRARVGVAAGVAGTAVLALALLFALRYAIGPQSGAGLHVDEAQYWDWSRHLQWGYYSKPPLIAALIGASSALFGDGVAGLRALAMACYPLTALVLALLARDLVAGPAEAAGTPASGPALPAAALWAAALFACSPLAGLLGLVATTDAPLLLAWSLALWALWRAVVSVQLRPLAWSAFAVALAAGLLGKYTMAALVPGAVLFAWRVGGRRALVPLAAALAAAALLCLPNAVWNAQAGWPTWRHTAEITLGTQGAADPTARAAWHGFGEFVAGQLLMLAPLALPWLMWLGWRRRRAPDRFGADSSGKAALALRVESVHAHAGALLGWTALPLLAVGLLQAARGRAEVNWIAPVQLSLALALAVYLAPRTAAAARATAGLLALQAVLITAVTLLPPWQRHWAPGSDLPVALDAWAKMRGFDAAYAELAPALPTAPGTTLIGTSRSVLAQAAYHWRGRGLLRATPPGGAVPGNHYQLSCPWQPGDSGAPVMVLSEGAAPPELAAALGGLEVVARTRVRISARRGIDLELARAVAPPAPVAGLVARRCR